MARAFVPQVSPPVPVLKTRRTALPGVFRTLWVTIPSKSHHWPGYEAAMTSWRVAFRESKAHQEMLRWRVYFGRKKKPELFIL